MLGLKEHADARAGDGTGIDVLDGARCPDDMFPGTMLDLEKWTQGGTSSQISIVVSDDLRFLIPSGTQAGDRDIRAKQLSDMTGGAAVAHITEIPSLPGVDISFAFLDTADAPVYRMRISSGATPTLLVFAGEMSMIGPALVGANQYLRMRDAGTMLAFGVSSNNMAYSEVMLPNLPVSKVRATLVVANTQPQSLGSRAVFASFDAPCQ